MESPREGQIWVFDCNPERIIRIVACDDEAQMVTSWDEIGEHKSLSRRPISYFTLRGNWYPAGSRTPRQVDQSNWCKLVRGALYRMKAPSDQQKGRVIRLMQWNDEKDVIPGMGEGYEDHGEPPKYQKSLAISRFRAKWEMVAPTLEQYATYLITGKPVGVKDQGRAEKVGKTRAEKQAEAIKATELQADLETARMEIAALKKRLEELEASADPKVVHIDAGRKRVR